MQNFMITNIYKNKNSKTKTKTNKKWGGMREKLEQIVTITQ